MIQISNRKKISVAASLLVIILGSLLNIGVALAVTTQGTYSYWAWDAPPADGYTSLQNDLRIQYVTPDSHYFWAHQFKMLDGDGGYIGLQEGGNSVSGIIGRTAIFSIFNTAIQATPVKCKVETSNFDGGTGSGTSCRIPYNWIENRKYRMSTELIETNVTGNKWGGWVEDLTTSTKTLIGEIYTPNSWKGMNGFSTSMWTEHFGQNPTTCESQAYSYVDFYRPVANSNVSAKPNSYNKFTQNAGCNTSHITSYSGWVSQEMGIRPGGFTPINDTVPPPSIVSSPPSYNSLLTDYGSGDDQFSILGDIATDSEGNVYISDSGKRCIQKFDSNDNLLYTWPSGTGDNQVNTPGLIAMDASNHVYITDSKNGNTIIKKFDSDGNFLSLWGESALEDGLIAEINDMAIDSTGDIYIVDRFSNSRIQKFDSDGNFILEWAYSGADGPINIAIDSGDNIYVTGGESIMAVQKFDSDGNFIREWGEGGNANGEFYNAYGIAIDPLDNVYIADSYNSRIQKFDSDGNFLSLWGTAGTGNGQFQATGLIAANKTGDLYVSDYLTFLSINFTDPVPRIQKFSYPKPSVTMPTINPDGTFADTTVTIGLKSAYAEISCSESIPESSHNIQDINKDYPLGLQNFCVEAPDSPNQHVTITYETDLTPSEVIVQKYSTITQLYTSLPGATITEDMIGGRHVLVLTYQINDGGVLDDDGQTNGTIVDPVGLAVNVQNNNTGGTNNTGNPRPNVASGQNTQNGGLANTGTNLLILLFTSTILVLLGLITLRRSRYKIAK